ncbi:MAG: hypothetical protein ABIG61_08450, partial [Planctomycetota bacterium]
MFQNGKIIREQRLFYFLGVGKAIFHICLNLQRASTIGTGDRFVLIPKPYVNQVRYSGVFAPNSNFRKAYADLQTKGLSHTIGPKQIEFI